MLAAGHSPVDIFDCNRSEAAVVMTALKGSSETSLDSQMDVARAALEDLRLINAGVSLEELPSVKEDVRRIRGGSAVVEWYLRKRSNSSMTKDRVTHGPNEMVRNYTYHALIDEILEEDLVNGVNTSPDDVFTAAAERRMKQYLARLGENVELPTCPITGTEDIRQIRSSQQLIAEGRDMRHCVGGYVSACLKGVSYIFSVAPRKTRVVQERATLELVHRDGQYTITQVYGYTDRAAPADCSAVVEAWAKERGLVWR